MDAYKFTPLKNFPHEYVGPIGFPEPQEPKLQLVVGVGALSAQSAAVKGRGQVSWRNQDAIAAALLMAA